MDVATIGNEIPLPIEDPNTRFYVTIGMIILGFILVMLEIPVLNTVGALMFFAGIGLLLYAGAKSAVG